VIVGASLAGAKAAETLRHEGFDGHVVLLGVEAERPYERPPLSKEYLRGETSDKPYVHDDGYYEGNDIELRTSTEVESIDPDASEVVLAGGERIGYDRLLLTTGSEPRRLSVPGSDLDGILYLRTVADSDAIAERIEAGGKLVTIGAGLIGAQIAASARTKGCEVTVLEMAALPLERVLGPELGAIYRDIHTDHGVELLAETALESFEGSGSVESVRTADGRTIDADFVVVGIGVAQRTKLAEDAGLDVENGVLTTERLETSAQGVYAAGDIANATHPLLGQRIRVEHWANALNQGPAAARGAGLQATVLESAPLPLLRALGPEVAKIFAALHRDHGVDMRCGVQVAEIVGGLGHATGVRLGDGSLIPADAVIVGAGILPNTRLAASAGLKVDNGIRVDEHLRSSHPDVYAAGDVANAFHPLLGKHIRVEHWANAVHQPQTAAHSMMGLHASYRRLPYFFTDQYDLGMEYTGHVDPGDYDQVVLRGDVQGREFIAFWLKQGRVLAGMNVNVWDVAGTIEAIILAGRPVDTAKLGDPDAPLDSLV